MNSLQKKYNDWRDAGRDHTDFCAKNKLLTTEHEKTCDELSTNYLKLQAIRIKDPKERLKIIRKRIKNYREHENDPYAYYPGEINEVRTLLHYAPDDIEFLLDLIDEHVPPEMTEESIFPKDLKSENSFLQNTYNKYRDAGGGHGEFVAWNDLEIETGDELLRNYEKLGGNRKKKK